MSAGEVVGYEVQEGGRVALITIRRPEKLNAINRQVGIELQAAWQRFQSGPELVAVVAGEGNRAFSAGADVSDLPELWRAIPGVGTTITKPVIAAVSGHCVGGAIVLVQHCDLCIAAENTRFSYPEARMGFTGGMIAGLVARIPHKIAMELILMGRPVSAQRAYEAGFVNAVVPDGQHVATALEWAHEMAGFAPLVMQTIKQFVNEGVLPKSPTERMNIAQRDLQVVSTSEDGAEGRAAWRERRPPRYTGR